MGAIRSELGPRRPVFDKTYTITALGLLHDEGKLELEEKLVDIFPQYMPEVISENLQAMTVRNLMSFGSGVEQMVSIADADWLRRFFALPVTNPPGSSFFYSGVCTAVGELLCVNGPAWALLHI